MIYCCINAKLMLHSVHKDGDNMNIGDRIKKRRLALGLSVDELASKIGKNRATIYRYENNEIENLPLTTLEPLAIALETTPSYLIGWDDSNKTYQDETFEHYLTKIGIPCEYTAIHRSPLSDLPLYEEYYDITILGNSYHLPVDRYKSLNENVLLLVIEYATSNNRNIEKLLNCFFKLSDIGKKKVVDNIEDLSKIYSEDTTYSYVTEESSPYGVNAAHERTDIEVTNEMRKQDDDIMDDENF